MGWGARLAAWFAARRRRPSEFVEPAVEDEDDFDPSNPFGDARDFPVRDEIDLHGLPPKMIREVVEAYLVEARRLGFVRVRIVHGKGIGAQREHVRKILERTSWVEAFGDAPADGGGWGATVARLRIDDGEG